MPMPAQTFRAGARWGWALPALLGAALCLPDPARASEPLPSPLDRPALMSPAAATVPLTVATVTADGDALVAGARGVVLRRAGDAPKDGAGWRQTAAPVSVTLTAMALPPAGPGYAVGHGGVILRTADDGRTWTRLRDGRTTADDLRRHLSGAGRPLPEWAEDWLAILEDEAAGQPLLNVCVLPGTDAVLATGAFGQLWRSDDQGGTWTPLFDHLPVDERYHLYGLACTADSIVIGAEFGRLYRSTDGGDTFTSLDSGADGTFFGVIADGADTLVAYGLRGLALRSTDGGASWAPLPLPVETTLVAAVRTSDGGLRLLSREGEVLAAPPGWASVTLDRTVPGGPFSDLALLDDGTLFLAGAAGPLRVSPRSEASHD